MACVEGSRGEGREAERSLTVDKACPCVIVTHHVAVVAVADSGHFTDLIKAILLTSPLLLEICDHFADVAAATGSR